MGWVDFEWTDFYVKDGVGRIWGNTSHSDPRGSLAQKNSQLLLKKTVNQWGGQKTRQSGPPPTEGDHHETMVW